MGESVERDPRWARVVARDASADGELYYSVKTTGVYCRPSCAARRANPRNVRFHATPAEAEAAGFRPCKRCRPDEPSRGARDARLVANACRAIEAAERAPTLAALAAGAGLSAWHFHRIFKAQTGVTPRQYAAARREERTRAALATGRTVTDAIYAGGFASSGRFYEDARAWLGMTPTAYRAGGGAATIRFATGACSLGTILVAATAKGLCAILLGDGVAALRRELRERFPRATLVDGDAAFAATLAAVVAFVEAPRLGLDLPLDIQGTAFQRRVWRALQRIPAGATVSYSEVARAISAPRSVRAVATACAANPLALAIPCHRVVRQGGGLAGYRWGVARKRALLAREYSE
jgi:AraC family transcriptional regulator of adaptative response/methylated-DNA-[protein]-cysteine methyltransferase